MQGVWTVVNAPIPGIADLLPTYRCADLDVELAHGVAVVHGVEGCHFVDTHWRHLEYPGHLVHDADAAESVLALAQVEQRHDGRLLVLRGVAGDNLLDELLILRREFEGDLGVVLGRVAMLQTVLARCGGGAACGQSNIRH